MCVPVYNMNMSRSLNIKIYMTHLPNISLDWPMKCVTEKGRFDFLKSKMWGKLPIFAVAYNNKCCEFQHDTKWPFINEVLYLTGTENNTY